MKKKHEKNAYNILKIPPPKKITRKVEGEFILSKEMQKNQKHEKNAYNTLKISKKGMGELFLFHLRILGTFTLSRQISG